MVASHLEATPNGLRIVSSYKGPRNSRTFKSAKEFSKELQAFMAWDGSVLREEGDGRKTTLSVGHAALARVKGDLRPLVDALEAAMPLLGKVFGPTERRAPGWLGDPTRRSIGDLYDAYCAALTYNGRQVRIGIDRNGPAVRFIKSALPLVARRCNVSAAAIETHLREHLKYDPRTGRAREVPGGGT